MKKSFVFVACCLLTTAFSFSQGTWTQKANYGGGKRSNAVGFSIDAKGYIGAGIDTNSSVKKDFWEWDQTSDIWTQKANYGGASGGFGFSIGTKGYIGTAAGNDFWEWDQGTNIWTQKANFGGAARVYEVAFSIGSKGYIGTGVDWVTGSVSYNDFWEWDQGTNIWTQKANFGGAARNGAVGFSIGSKGYIGIGVSGIPINTIYYHDFWEWDQVTDTWTQKAIFPGAAGYGFTGFSIGAKGYVSGVDSSSFWQWNQTINVWTKKAVFGGNPMVWGVGFSIGAKGYIGTGEWSKDFWEYTPDSTTGVNELNNTVRIAIYPNPTAGKANVVINPLVDLQMKVIEVYNIHGEKIYNKDEINSSSNFQIDLSSQPEGLYFMQVKTSDGVLTKKIIVQR